MKHIRILLVVFLLFNSCANIKKIRLTSASDYEIVSAYFNHFYGAKKVLNARSYSYDWSKHLTNGVFINHYSDNFRETLIKTKKRFNFEDYISDRQIQNMVSQITPIKSVKWDRNQLNPIKTSRAKTVIKFTLPVYSLNKEIAAVFIDDYKSTYVAFFIKKNSEWEFYFSGTVEIE